MSVGIIVGHRRGAQGAVAVDGTTEHVWAMRHAGRLRLALLALGRDSAIFFRDDDRGGYARLPSQLNTAGVSCAVALHFNSFGSKKATGSEVLYWHASPRGHALARTLAAADDVLGLEDRGDSGTVAIKKGDRGWPLLAKTNMPAVIVEPAFGSNPEDWRALTARGADLAAAQAAAIVAWLKDTT